MEEKKTKKRGHVSTEVRARYNNKAYEVIRASAIPKEKGLRFKELAKENGESINSIIEKAIDAYIEANKGEIK